jgi:small-conductance mechanosensitive channel
VLSNFLNLGSFLFFNLFIFWFFNFGFLFELFTILWFFSKFLKFLFFKSFFYFLNFLKNWKHFQIFKHATTSSRSCGRSAMSSSVLSMRRRSDTLEEILANSERGSSEMCEAEITHGGFGSEFWPVSKLEFYGHPNSGIRASKF